MLKFWKSWGKHHRNTILEMGSGIFLRVAIYHYHWYFEENVIVKWVYQSNTWKVQKLLKPFCRQPGMQTIRTFSLAMVAVQCALRRMVWAPHMAQRRVKHAFTCHSADFNAIFQLMLSKSIVWFVWSQKYDLYVNSISEGWAYCWCCFLLGMGWYMPIGNHN